MLFHSRADKKKLSGCFDAGSGTQKKAAIFSYILWLFKIEAFDVTQVISNTECRPINISHKIIPTHES